MNKILFVVLMGVGIFWIIKGMVDGSDLLSIKGLVTVLLADKII